MLLITSVDDTAADYPKFKKKNTTKELCVVLKDSQDAIGHLIKQR